MASVSVLMPVYNCAPFVVDAARSILGQDYRDLELLVVDDGSTDATYDTLISAVSDERMTVIRGAVNCGLPARLNELLDLANGQYIARMDGDDISYPSRIATQLQCLQDNETIDLVACSMVVIDNENRLVGKNAYRGSRLGKLSNRPWRGLHLNHGTWLAPASFFTSKRYDESAHLVEDEEIILRSLTAHGVQELNVEVLSKVLYAYRVDKLRLGQILLTRLNFVQMLARRAFLDNRPSYLLAIPDQAAKALVDSFVIGLGFEKRLLKHRFGPLEPADRELWEATLRRFRILGK